MANQVDLLYRLSAHDQLITDYAHTHIYTFTLKCGWYTASLHDVVDLAGLVGEISGCTGVAQGFPKLYCYGTMFRKWLV